MRSARLLLAALALAVPGSALAGGAGAPPPETPRIVGLLPFQAGEPTELQLALASFGMLLVRNALTGSESVEPDPWPCREGGYELLGFLPNDRSAYDRVRAGLIAQGFVAEREIAQNEAGTTLVFQYRRGPLVLVGLWGKGASGPRSTIGVCESALPSS